MSSNGQNLTKAQRREAARAQALELKKKQEAADKRARLITMSILGVVLVALVVIVAWLFIRHNKDTAANAVEDIPLSEVVDVPSTAREDGGILLAPDGAAGGTPVKGAPEIGVYFDYMCPGCHQFEEVNIGTLEDFLADGTANVVMFPLSIIDRLSQGTEYSTRAATASVWVADRAPAHYLPFHKALFVNAPDEGTEGLTDQQLAEIAEQVGVPATVAEGIASGEARRTFGQWVYSATNSATRDEALKNPAKGSFTSPTITIDGVRQAENWADPTALPQAVAEATE